MRAIIVARVPTGEVTYSFDDFTTNGGLLTGVHKGIDFGTDGNWSGFTKSNGFTGCACYTSDDSSNTINFKNLRLKKTKINGIIYGICSRKIKGRLSHEKSNKYFSHYSDVILIVAYIYC